MNAQTIVLKYAISRTHDKATAKAEALVDIDYLDKEGYFEDRSGISRNCITVTMKQIYSNKKPKLKELF